MVDLTNIHNIKAILNKYNFKFCKKFGQNFLINPDVCPKMVRESLINGNRGVIEIGPGFGVLTQELVKNYERVVSVELDSRLIPILSNIFKKNSNISFVSGDILKLNINDLIKSHFMNVGGINLCANLPYNVASKLIIKVLCETDKIDAIVVMTQKEVAERICATVNSKQYGALSIFAQFYADVKILFDVSNESFIPKPKVTSSVIKLCPNKNKFSFPKDLKSKFDIIVKKAFSNRRKAILNSLAHGLNIPKLQFAYYLQSVNIGSDLRAENLTINNFVDLTKLLSKVGII